MIRKFIGGWALALGFMLVAAGAAAAQCCVSSTHQVRVPSVVVSRPQTQTGCGSCATPPSCSSNCSTCSTCGQGSFTGEVTVSANASATANANANTRANFIANSAAFGLGGAINGSAGYGGGGGGFYVGGTSGYIPNLTVDNGASSRSAYQASRTVIKVVVIQAVCLDTKLVPHPASQVTPDREIKDTYEGELFRCLAGTRLQYTFADYKGDIQLAGGQTASCEKGDALYRSANGAVSCRPQKPARDCNERSLLRRFGAGVKIIKIVTTETYTAYREEHAQASAGMALDGGVGGVVY